MYSVKIYDGPSDQEGTIIHSPFIDDLKVFFDITLVTKGISDMTFTINAKSPAWNQIRPLVTLIEVVNVRTNKKVFDGRVLKPSQMMTTEGMFSTKYTCETKLAYLNDSNQRHAKFQDTTIADFFAYLIETHNAQVEPHKRFKVGNVTVMNNTDNVYRFVGYDKTFAEIKDNLLDRLGGFLVVREESDGTYIDYLAEVGEQKETPIRLRKNLKSMRRDINPTDIITRIIPLGAREEAEEGETGDASEPRLDITSVNGGLDYLDDNDLQAEFGIIEGTLILDDVNTPEILKLRGEQFFASQKAARISYDVTPVDLSLIDDSFDSFELGNWHPIINPVFEIEEHLQIIEKKINGENPQRDQLTIGEKYRTLTEYQVEANKKSRKIVQLENNQERQSQSISALKTELSAVDSAVQQVQITLSDSDLPALEDAVISLNEALDNLVNAIDDIPIYELATTTVDGLMSALDKIKLDSLEAYELATELINGLMSATDKTKLNKITVINTVDLDELVARVEALENV